VVFELRDLESGKVIRRYATEGAALALVRDVVRFGGRDQAAAFMLAEYDVNGDEVVLASGAALVQRALEDRAE
jgi:hypothetical protein